MSHFTNVFIFLYFRQTDTTYLRLTDSIFHSISLFYFAYLATDEPGADYVWHLLSQVKRDAQLGEREKAPFVTLTRSLPTG